MLREQLLTKHPSRCICPLLHDLEVDKKTPISFCEKQTNRLSAFDVCPTSLHWIIKEHWSNPMQTLRMAERTGQQLEEFVQKDKNRAANVQVVACAKQRRRRISSCWQIEGWRVKYQRNYIKKNHNKWVKNLQLLPRCLLTFVFGWGPPVLGVFRDSLFSQWLSESP